MKKLSTLLAGAALIMGFTTTANALSMRLTDGVNTVTVADGGIGDFNSTVGAVTYIGNLGDFLVNVSTGISRPALGSAAAPFMDLNSVNVSTGNAHPANLKIYLSDTFFNGIVPGFVARIGGTTSGTLEYRTYFDAGNVEFGQTTLLTDLLFNTPAFSGSASSVTPTSGDPYSLTQEINITHPNGGPTSFNATLNPVPEPGTMVLLGAGLLGLAVYGKRRMNKGE